MIFLDTSFVVAWVNPNDSLHERALALLESDPEEPWLTTDCVLLEIGNSLSRYFRTEAADIIETILDDEHATVIGLDTELFSRAFQLYRTRTDKTWGLIDCVSFIVMQDHRCFDAWTNDIHFVQAGFSALLRHPE
jgi:predicted nucleic acid-binding protein